MTSDPPDYVIEEVVFIDTKSLAQSNMVVEESHTLEVKFDMNYDSSEADNYAAQFMNAYCASNDLYCDSVTQRQGGYLY